MNSTELQTAPHRTSADFGRTLAALFATCIISVFATDASAERILDIRSRVNAAGAQVRLVDLVTDPAELSETERAHTIMPTPEAGATKNLTLVNLAYRLQRYLELLDVRLRGPSRIVVSGGGDPGFLQKCRKDLTDCIAQTAPWSDWTIKVQFGLDEEHRLAAAATDYHELAVQPRGSALLGSVELDVVFLDADGNTLSECAIQPTILRQASVLMMPETCKRDHLLTAEDIRPTPVWLGSESNQYVRNAEQAVGAQLNRRLSAGELLRQNHLSAPLYAKRGDMVQVQCRTGALVVSLSAKALDNGRKGDSIRLRNTTSDSVFKAVLDGRKKAIYER